MTEPQLDHEIRFVPLSMLRPGDEAPGGSINVRKTAASKEDDEATKASIFAEGVVQSLAVFQFGPDTSLYVGAGNRRLRLARELAVEGKIGDDFLIPAIIYTGKTAAQARAISAAENVARAPLHPVDRFEAFKQHVDDGMSEAGIAARYAMPKKAVKQALALGALSPKVREMWREGKINAEVAGAFTLAATHEMQDAVLEKHGGVFIQAYQVRSAITGDQRDVSGALKFVGKRDYEKAGGAVIEDLFEGGKYVSDAALLSRMVDDKLREECERLVKDGWAWAALESEVGNARYSWRRINAEPVFTDDQAARKAALEKEFEDKQDAGDHDGAAEAEMRLGELLDAVSASGFTAEQKAKSGCVVSLGRNGDVEIEAGYVKPADEKAHAGDAALDARAAEKPEAKKEGSGVSEALTNRLTEALTEAAANAVEQDPGAALCILLAGFAAQWGAPARVSCRGMKSGDGLGRERSFDKTLASVIEMSAKERNALLTKIVGQTLDLRLFTRQRESIEDKSVAALLAALPGRALMVELKRLFSAEDYFGSVSKALCLAAIEEAVNKDEARKLAGKPKGEVAKFAVTNVPKTGWLPEAMRTVHYDGPGAKAKKAATKKRGAK